MFKRGDTFLGVLSLVATIYLCPPPRKALHEIGGAQ